MKQNQISESNNNNQEKFICSGYASCFNFVDHQQDVVLPGAFEGSIKRHESGQFLIKLLWQHNQTQPIGTIKTLREDAYGLYFEAEINTQIAQGKEAASLIKQKAINSFSIGFAVTKYNLTSAANFTNHEIDPEINLRLLESIELYEISLVTFPANERATILEHSNRKVPANDNKTDNNPQEIKDLCSKIIKFTNKLNYHNK